MTTPFPTPNSDRFQSSGTPNIDGDSDVSPQSAPYTGPSRHCAPSSPQSESVDPQNNLGNPATTSADPDPNEFDLFFEELGDACYLDDCFRNPRSILTACQGVSRMLRNPGQVHHLQSLLGFLIHQIRLTRLHRSVGNMQKDQARHNAETQVLKD